MVARGISDSRELLAEAERIVLEAGGKIDYIKIVDSDTLADADPVDQNSRLLLAVKIGNTRLIDNSSLPA